MKKYHVYGIGNALVDYDFEVSDIFLSELTVNKGLMTLIDEARQHELLLKLQNTSHKKACGGSAANTLIAISQLGGECFYTFKVANDKAGHFYLQHLCEQGIAYRVNPDELENGHTGKCLVFVTPDADRTMNTHVGITHELSVKDITPDAIIASSFVYIEGYLVTSPTAKAAAIETKAIAEAHHVKTALSLSDPNMTVHYKSGLNAMIGQGVDFLFCNEDEALRYTGSQDLTAAVDMLKQISTHFAITRGAKGALLFDGNQYHDIPAVPIRAIDTVGAGDMFAGAMLYGLSQGFPLRLAAELANEAAAKIVSQIGPRLDITEARELALKAKSLLKHKEIA